MFNLQGYYNKENLKSQYVFIAKKEKFFDKNGQVKEQFKQTAIKVSNLKKYLSKTNPNQDLYISVNTFNNKKRKNKNVASYNAAFIDIDLYECTFNNYGNALYIKEIIQEKINNKEIPAPSRIVFTGGGLHYYWYLNNVNEKEFKLIEKALISYFEKIDLGQGYVDKSVCDAARILRIPGSLNTKEIEICRVIEDKQIDYTFEDFKKYGLLSIHKNYKEECIHLNVYKNKKTKKANPKYIYNNEKYLERVFKSLKLIMWYRINNKIDITGYREISMFLYKYIGLAYTNNRELIMQEIFEMNEMMVNPLDKDEILTALSNKDVEMAGKLFHESGYIKYKYSNNRLYDLLRITEELLLACPGITIIKDKKARKRLINKENYHDRKKRKPVKQISYTKMQSINTKLKIAKLLARGIAQIDIAKRLNVTKQYVSKVIKELKDNGIIDKLTNQIDQNIILAEKKYGESVAYMIARYIISNNIDVASIDIDALYNYIVGQLPLPATSIG